uniref:Translocon-associated protein subunit alpha n=1 Tax=Oryctolagus cuniculus TaxID=9986 RepID=A0A5F9D1I6_RABIT
MRLLPRLLLLLLLVFPATVLLRGGPGGSLAEAQDLTEDEETVEDSVIEDEDDEAEVEEDEPTDLAEDKEEEDVSGEPEASPSADTTILFVKGEDFPANNIVKFLVGFTNKGTEDFIVESLDASFRYPQDYQFYIQNFTALPLNTIVPPQRQATFEYSFIPAEPMGGRPFGLVINLNYKDFNGNVFQDAVFNQTVTVIEREDGLDGETIFMYMFLAGLGLLVVVGLHQLLESRKIKLLRDGCPGRGRRRDRWDLMSKCSLVQQLSLCLPALMFFGLMGISAEKPYHHRRHLLLMCGLSEQICGNDIAENALRSFF